MMTEPSRATLAWQHIADSKRKFDYFMAGLIAAALGFQVQRLPIDAPGFNPFTLDVLVTVGLGGALAHAIYQIRFGVLSSEVTMHDILFSARRSALVRESGPLPEGSLEAERIKQMDRAIAQVDEVAKRLSSHMTQCSDFRDRLLLAAVLGILVSQVWRGLLLPLHTSTTAHTQATTVGDVALPGP